MATEAANYFGLICAISIVHFLSVDDGWSIDSIQSSLIENHGRNNGTIYQYNNMKCWPHDARMRPIKRRQRSRRWLCRLDTREHLVKFKSKVPCSCSPGRRPWHIVNGFRDLISADQNRPKLSVRFVTRGGSSDFESLSRSVCWPSKHPESPIDIEKRGLLSHYMDKWFDARTVSFAC